MKRNSTSNFLTIHKIMMYLLAFGISFPDKYIPMVLAGWLLTTIFGFFINAFEKPVEKMSFFHQATILLLFSFWSILTIIYSEDVTKGIDLLVRRLSLIVFACAVFLPYNPKVNRKTLFVFFVAGNITVLFIVLTKALISTYSTPVWTDSLYLDPIPFMKYLLDGIKHRTYLSLNLAISLLLLFYLASEYKKMRWSVLFLSISFILISALTYGRISILIVTVLALFSNLNLWLKSRKSITLVFLSFVVGLIVLISLFHPRLNAVKENTSEDMPRFLLWANAIELVKEKPVFGYGIGDARKVFNQKNDSETGSPVAGKNLNAHNQFIDFQLESGLIGVLLFISFVFLLLFNRSLDKKGRFMFAFIWFVCFMFETMLNRIAAISVLGFSFWLLYNQNFQESDYKISKTVRHSIFFSSVILLLYFALVAGYVLMNNKEIDPEDPKTFSMNTPTVISYDELPGIIPDVLSSTCGALKLDNSSSSESWSGNAHSFTLIDNMKVNNETRVNAGVYCFVSDDFNGHSVRLVAEGTASRGREAKYDLNRKGEWQYLFIAPEFDNGRIPIYLYMTLNGALNFKHLDGYVLFAYSTTQISLTMKN